MTAGLEVSIRLNPSPFIGETRLTNWRRKPESAFHLRTGKQAVVHTSYLADKHTNTHNQIRGAIRVINFVLRCHARRFNLLAWSKWPLLCSTVYSYYKNGVTFACHDGKHLSINLRMSSLQMHRTSTISTIMKKVQCNNYNFNAIINQIW